MLAIELKPEQLSELASQVATHLMIEQAKELRDLKEMIGQLMSGNEKGATLLTIGQLSREINISEATIARRVKEGKIPSIKAGGVRRFDLQKVLEALAAS